MRVVGLQSDLREREASVDLRAEAKAVRTSGRLARWIHRALFPFSLDDNRFRNADQEVLLGEVGIFSSRP